MKIRTYWIFVIFIILIVYLGFLQPVQAPYTADSENFTLVSPIQTNSPSNTTYATNQICLNFTVKTYINYRNNNMTLIYSLDMKNNVTIPIKVVDVKNIVDADSRRTVINLITGVVNFENLQKESHSLTVYVIYSTHKSQKAGYDNKLSILQPPKMH